MRKNVAQNVPVGGFGLKEIQRKDHVFHRLKEQTTSQSDVVPL
jgi:hypothetical protein